MFQPVLAGFWFIERGEADPEIRVALVDPVAGSVER